MQQKLLSWRPPYWVTAIVTVWALLTFISSTVQRPVEATGDGERVVTIYDGGSEMTFVTSAKTVESALERGEIDLNEQDATEPSINTELVAKNYHINIYRARPVVVVDGDTKTSVVTPKQSGREIAENAGVNLYPEDKAVVERVDDAIQDGTAAQRVTVDRATVFTFILYGEEQTVRTHAPTVREFLDEIEVDLADNDMTSLSLGASIKEGMKLKLWREGKQTITVEERADFSVRQIQDSTKRVGYREVRTPGKHGKKQVVYEVVIKNGKEVSRKKIQSVITTKPVEQIEVVGTKSNFSGSREQWLRILRECEAGGNYQINTGNGFYGAYQFMKATWDSTAHAIGRPDLARVMPHEASPADQDLMVIANTNRSGGGLATQHPGCYQKHSLSQFPPN
jgi:resuscitation-promoting factor RpfB